MTTLSNSASDFALIFSRSFLAPSRTARSFPAARERERERERELH